MSNPVSLRLSNVTKHGQVTSSFPLISVTRSGERRKWTKGNCERRITRGLFLIFGVLSISKEFRTPPGLEEKKGSRRDRAIIENTVSFHFMRSDKVMTVMTLFSLRFARFIMYRVEIRLRKLMEMEFNHWKERGTIRIRLEVRGFHLLRKKEIEIYSIIIPD